MSTMSPSSTLNDDSSLRGFFVGELLTSVGVRTKSFISSLTSQVDHTRLSDRLNLKDHPRVLILHALHWRTRCTWISGSRKGAMN